MTIRKVPNPTMETESGEAHLHMMVFNLIYTFVEEQNPLPQE